MSTIPLRNSETISMVGFAAPNPSGNSPFEGKFELGITTSNILDNYVQSWYNDTDYFYSMYDNYPPDPSYPAFLSPQASTLGNYGFINGKAIICQFTDVGDGPGPTVNLKYAVIDYTLNTDTVSSSLSDYGVISGYSSSAQFDGTSAPDGSTWGSLSMFSDTELMLPLCVTDYTDVLGSFVYVAVYDGAVLTLYNALNFPSISNFGINLKLLADKYDGNDHNSILYAFDGSEFKLYHAPWTPSPFIDGISGTFGTTFNEFDFDDATLNAITSGFHWNYIDFGNDNPYGFYSATTGGTLYLIAVAKDFSYYDLYEFTGLDPDATTVLSGVENEPWAGWLVYNQVTEKISVQYNNQFDPKLFATGDLIFDNPTPPEPGNVGGSIPVVPIMKLGCGNYCLPMH